MANFQQKGQVLFNMISEEKPDSKMVNGINPEYLTVDQVAARLQVSQKTIRKWISENRLPGLIRLGRRCIRFRAVDLEKRLLNGQLLLDTI